ncbi:alpha/beta hydrolase [Mesorhizobium sp. M0998]|uniref:alpha/beta hydrolase n=1 Tax=Mesorhizobium sp. M0998 TaxID=2957044 RepID=UPI0033367F4D
MSTSMVYWADVMYPEPDANVAAYESVGELVPSDVDASSSALVPGIETPSEALFLAMIAAKTGGLLAAAEAAEAVPENRMLDGVSLERVPLPWGLKAKFLETYLRDVHHYLFDADFECRPGSRFHVQQEIRSRFVSALAAAPNGERHYVVSHSMGTVIAYDCLMRVPECPPVDGLITIGSPLGLDEIQDKLAPEWSRAMGYPIKLRGDWVNIFDRLDVVAGFDPFIANDFLKDGIKVVSDIAVRNDGAWRHSITKYMRQASLRKALTSMLGF